MFKFLIVASSIVMVWWLQNFSKGYFWFWGEHTWPLSGAIVSALFVVAITLLIAPKNQNLVFSERKLLGYPIRFLKWCGFYCYGIYVWHAVIATLDMYFLHTPLGPPLLGLLLLAVPLAPLSYKLIEEPMLRYKMPRKSNGARKSQSTPFKRPKMSWGE